MAAGVLHAAAALTLDLAQALLRDGLGLKTRPRTTSCSAVRSRCLSTCSRFERRDAGDPTWLPYAQFVRTFLLPLLANRHFGIALDQILTTPPRGVGARGSIPLVNTTRAHPAGLPVACDHAGMAGQ